MDQALRRRLLEQIVNLRECASAPRALCRLARFVWRRTEDKGGALRRWVHVPATLRLGRSKRPVAILEQELGTLALGEFGALATCRAFRVFVGYLARGRVL